MPGAQKILCLSCARKLFHDRFSWSKFHLSRYRIRVVRKCKKCSWVRITESEIWNVKNVRRHEWLSASGMTQNLRFTVRWPASSKVHDSCVKECMAARYLSPKSRSELHSSPTSASIMYYTYITIHAPWIAWSCNCLTLSSQSVSHGSPIFASSISYMPVSCLVCQYHVLHASIMSYMPVSCHICQSNVSYTSITHPIPVSCLMQDTRSRIHTVLSSVMCNDRYKIRKMLVSMAYDTHFATDLSRFISWLAASGMNFSTQSTRWIPASYMTHSPQINNMFATI